MIVNFVEKCFSNCYTVNENRKGKRERKEKVMKKIIKNTEKICKVLLILMFSISQFSFPLEVLAEELNNDNEEAVQEELTENENTTEFEEEGSTGTEEEDSTGTEEEDSTGTEEEGSTGTEEDTNILSSYTELKYMDGTYYVKGGKEYLTVENILSNFNITELETDLALKLYITDLDGNILENTEEVKNEYKLILIDAEQTEAENYLLKIEGDYTEDSLVTEEDAKILVDKILNNETNDLMEEAEFNILDATNPVFTTGSWENNLVNQDLLTNSLENKAEINKGEELTVKYYINGFEYDSLTGIQGKINYNQELLELTNVEIDSLYGNINEDGKFVYLLDNYQSNDILMTLTFKAISAGEATISIDEIMASTGILADLDGDSISTTITILDFGIGGDVEEEETTTPIPETPLTPESTETTDETVQEPVVIPTVYSTNTTVKRVTLSSDNLIKSLKIKGYDIDFDQNTYEYSIKVKNSVKSLDLTIELNDEKASYTVEGNEKFKVGENTVIITVTAEDGSTKTYTIKVNREEEEEETTEEEEIEESSSSKTIIIILIILVIIGLIYVIFKDDEEDSKESKK